MSIIGISFNKLFTYNLLLYSWNCLKKTNHLLGSNKKIVVPPISKSWLQKTSYLISQGKFDYKFYSNNFGNGEKKVTTMFKFKIIENAFVLLLFISLRNGFFNDIDLIKYLRFNINFY